MKESDNQSCPLSTVQIIDHLPENSDSDSLLYLRSARMPAKNYWIWSFLSQNKPYYVTVSLSDNGDVCLCYEENTDNWTPEQFIEGEYNDRFYNHWRKLYTARYSSDDPIFNQLKS